MSAIITNKFRFAQAKSFIDSFATNNIYIAIAKSSPWTSGDGVSVDENNPATPSDTSTQDTKDFSQVLGMKLITSTGVSYVAPRQNWVTSTVYSMYDDQDLLLNTAGHYCYVVNPNTFGVYKCIWNNNGGASSIIPTGNSTSIFTTADNYQWKYMYTLLPSDISVFLNTNWFPIRDKLASTLSTDQLAVSSAAISGGIHAVKITTPGSGYTSGSFTISGSNVSGDGTGFTGTLTVVGGVLTSVSVITPGTGYTTCTLTLPAGVGAGSGTGAIRAIISPVGGHGTDPVVELNALYVMATTTLNYSESTELTVANDYRKIFLLQNPLLAAGTSQAIPGAIVKNNLLKINYNGSVSGTFKLDETVNFGSSASTGVLIDHDTVGKILYFSELNGSAVPSVATLTGTVSGATVSYTVAPIYPFFKSR